MHWGKKERKEERALFQLADELKRLMSNRLTSVIVGRGITAVPAWGVMPMAGQRKGGLTVEKEREGFPQTDAPQLHLERR